MATRASVETKIIAINDGGSNTASEVREVLTELLNYTENLTPTPSLTPFHITSPNPFISNRQSAKLYFSIKGLKEQFANMTIMFKSTNPEVTNQLFTIPFNQTTGMFTLENFNILAGLDGNGIIPLGDSGNYLMYNVPVLSNSTQNVIPTCILYVTLARSLGEFTNSLIISVQSFNGSGNFSTSIAMHSQKFIENFSVAPGNNTGNTAGGGTALAGGIRGKKEEGITIEEIFGINSK